MRMRSNKLLEGRDIMRLVWSAFVFLLVWETIRYSNFYISNNEIRDLLHVFYSVFFLIYFVPMTFKEKESNDDKNILTRVRGVSILCGVLCLGVYHFLSL